MTDLTKLLRRITVTVVGTILLAVGIVLLVAPGPGVLVIVLALAVFAIEYQWARQRLLAAKALARNAAEKTATNRVARVSAVLFGVGTLGLGGVLIFSDILPFSGLGTGLSVALAGLIVLATTVYSIRDLKHAQSASQPGDNTLLPCSRDARQRNPVCAGVIIASPAPHLAERGHLSRGRRQRR